MRTGRRRTGISPLSGSCDRGLDYVSAYHRPVPPPPPPLPRSPLLPLSQIAAPRPPPAAADPRPGNREPRPKLPPTTKPPFDAATTPPYRGGHPKVYAYIDAHQPEHVAALQRWLRQPSISAQSV